MYHFNPNAIRAFDERHNFTVRFLEPYEEVSSNLIADIGKNIVFFKGTSPHSAVASAIHEFNIEAFLLEVGSYFLIWNHDLDEWYRYTVIKPAGYSPYTFEMVFDPFGEFLYQARTDEIAEIVHPEDSFDEIKELFDVMVEDEDVSSALSSFKQSFTEKNNEIVGV